MRWLPSGLKKMSCTEDTGRSETSLLVQPGGTSGAMRLVAVVAERLEEQAVIRQHKISVIGRIKLLHLMVRVDSIENK